MDEREFERGFEVAERLIKDAEGRLQTAISDENWSRASELDSYVGGMNQILIVFEQAKARMIKE